MLCLFARSQWRTCLENGTKMGRGYNQLAPSRSARKVSIEVVNMEFIIECISTDAVDDLKRRWTKMGNVFGIESFLLFWIIKSISYGFFLISGTKHFLLMCNVRAEDSGEIKFVARHVESVAYLDVEGIYCSPRKQCMSPIGSHFQCIVLFFVSVCDVCQTKSMPWIESASLPY